MKDMLKMLVFGNLAIVSIYTEITLYSQSYRSDMGMSKYLE